jgi:predicted HicB family RNase H-like nuclease
VPRGKSKVKTDVITLRVEPHLKIAAKVAAEKDHRDLTNWIEVLILKRCEELKIETTRQSQESSE